MAPHSTLNSTLIADMPQSPRNSAPTETMPPSTLDSSSTTNGMPSKPATLPTSACQMPCGQSAPQRGMLAFQAGEPQGWFGRLPQDSPAASYGKTDDESIANSVALANVMTSSFDGPRDGSDGKESGKPALYTYLDKSQLLGRVALEIYDTISRSWGPVGGRIIAEVFLGLLFADKSSVLSMEPDFIPITGADIKLKDFVAHALGMGPTLTKGMVQCKGFGPHGTRIMKTDNGTNGHVPQKPISKPRATAANPVDPALITDRRSYW